MERHVRPRPETDGVAVVGVLVAFAAVLLGFVARSFAICLAVVVVAVAVGALVRVRGGEDRCLAVTTIVLGLLAVLVATTAGPA